MFPVVQGIVRERGWIIGLVDVSNEDRLGLSSGDFTPGDSCMYCIGEAGCCVVAAKLC